MNMQWNHPIIPVGARSDQELELENNQLPDPPRHQATTIRARARAGAGSGCGCGVGDAIQRPDLFFSNRFASFLFCSVLFCGVPPSPPLRNMAKWVGQWNVTVSHKCIDSAALERFAREPGGGGRAREKLAKR